MIPLDLHLHKLRGDMTRKINSGEHSLQSENTEWLRLWSPLEKQNQGLRIKKKVEGRLINNKKQIKEFDYFYRFDKRQLRFYFSSQDYFLVFIDKRLWIFHSSSC